MSEPIPSQNPILTAYQSYVTNTPLVTRYILNTLTITYLASFFTNPTLAVANIPLFTIQKFELYRLVLNHFVCEGLLSLIFVFFSFTYVGKRLEEFKGSTFLFLIIITIGTIINVCFLAFCYLLFFLSNNQMDLLKSNAGPWPIILALIAVESLEQAATNPNAVRRLFVIDIPIKYYPLALCGLFTLFSGFRLELFIGAGLGYAYSYGYIDKFVKIDKTKCQRYEQGCLVNFTRRSGWISVDNVSLPVSREGRENGISQSSGWTPSAFVRGQPTSSSSNAQQRPTASSNNPSSPAANDKPSFFSGGGQTLGSVGRPSNRDGSADARAAMLEAAERRAQTSDRDT